MIVPIQKQIDEILEDSKPKFGISTGLKKLDEAILGFRPSHLYMIGGYSGLGKSSIATDMTLAAAKEISVAFFSLEMGTNLIVERMVYNIADLNYHSGISGHLDVSDKEDLKKATKYIKELKDIYIDEKSRIMYPTWLLERETPVNSLELAIQEYYNCGCRIFFIDYIQIVEWGFKSEIETLRLKNITNKLHNLAVDLQVPIVALAQLKKEAGDRKKEDDMVPTLSSIRDSGFLINDSDVILLLHRPEYFKKKEEIDLFTNQKEEAQIIVAKARNGPIGKINVSFCGYSMSWKDSVLDVPQAGKFSGRF